MLARWVSLAFLGSAAIGLHGQTASMAQDVASAAQLADEAYRVLDKGYEAPPGYTLLDQDGGRYGFQAGAFQNKTTDEVIVAIAGTDSARDVLADIEIFLGNPLPGIGPLDAQIQDAFLFLDKVRNLVPSADVTIVGHSLGGYIAQVVGAATGARTLTINAPGVDRETVLHYAGAPVPAQPGTYKTSTPATQPGYALDTPLSNIENHIRTLDIFGTYGSHLGTEVYYPPRPGQMYKTTTPSTPQHPIDFFISDLVAGLRPLGPEPRSFRLDADPILLDQILLNYGYWISTSLS